MSEEPKPDNKHETFWTKGTIAFFIGIGVILLLFLAWLLMSWSAKASAIREISELRAAGQPVTPEEIAPPPVPEAENAAPLYQRAIIEADAAAAACDADENTKKFAGVPGGEWEEAGIAEIGANLDKMRVVMRHHDKVFPLVDRARALPRCRFDLDYSAGFAMGLPHLSELRYLARLLRARAFMRAHEGDVSGALRDVERIFDLRDALAAEPTLISQMVRVAIVQMAVGSLAEISADHVLPEADALRLARLLAVADLWPSIHLAIMGERAMGMDAIETVLTGEVTATGSKGTAASRAAASVGGFWLRWNQVTYIELMNKLVDAAALPPADAIERAQDIEDDLGDLPDWRGVFAKMMLPALSRAYKHTAAMQMSLQAAAVGLACDLYAREHGRPPADLADLAPEFFVSVPIDTFTGKPLKLSLTKAGFVVYSVGPNGTDEGGKHDPDDIDSNDVGWTYEKPGTRPKAVTAPAKPAKRRK